MHLSKSEDTGDAHLLKIKTRPDWLTPLPEEETPKTPEPDWVILPNELLETENNWADAMAKTYKDPEENKLLRKTGDMTYFIHWYCKQIGKKKLVKADFEGQAYKIGVPAGQVKQSCSSSSNKDLEWKYLVSGNKKKEAVALSDLFDISHGGSRARRFLQLQVTLPLLIAIAISSHIKIFLDGFQYQAYSDTGFTHSFEKDCFKIGADYKNTRYQKADFK
ncbi:hypothetical protein Tco_0956949 [Tanacetum coccineum]